MSSPFEMEGEKRREAFEAARVAELEDLKKTIDPVACREAYLATYAEKGAWLIPLACMSKKLKTEPSKRVKEQFHSQQSAPYHVDSIWSEKNKEFGTYVYLSRYHFQ